MLAGSPVAMEGENVMGPLNMKVSAFSLLPSVCGRTARVLSYTAASIACKPMQYLLTCGVFIVLVITNLR